MLAISWDEPVRRARTWAGHALSLVVPPLCEGCGHRVDEGCVLCCECVRALRPAGAERAGGLLVVAPFAYEGEVARRLMRRFKYQGARDLAVPIAWEMARAWRRTPLRRRDAWLVPVPVAPDRHRLRGFNQAALLARALGEALDLGVAELARRSRTGRSQTSLAPTERARNIAHAFQTGGASPHRPLVLVDDVATTGATLRALASALSAAGHTVLAAVTAFRTPPNLGRGRAVRGTVAPTGEGGARRTHELSLEK